MTSARDAHDSEGGWTEIIDKIIELIDKRSDDGWDEIAAKLKAIAEHKTADEEDVTQCGTEMLVHNDGPIKALLAKKLETNGYEIP